MSPQALAERVLEDRFGKEMPSIPIDPFRLMREYGIVYQFMEFEDLEGIYLVPEDDNDIPLVGINYKRKITRQRFTAAHELCHHLKDRRNEVCPKGETGDLMCNVDRLTISEYILRVLKIHHRITQIHPFRDGNGRSSRALLNWMLRKKGLPPIYFKFTEKELYYEALESADKHESYSKLLRVTIRELFRTIMKEK